MPSSDLAAAFLYLQQKHPSEASAVVLFGSILVGFYIFALCMAAWIVFRGKNPAGMKPGVYIFRFMPITTVALAVSGVVAALYSWFVEPNWIEVKMVRIPIAKKFHANRPLRIVQISDLHCEATSRQEEFLPEMIARQKPDLIAFTGDAINCPEGLPIFKRCMKRLSAIAPTFAIEGNWDAAYWRHLDLFGGTGVKNLQVEAMSLPGSPDVWIMGVPVGGTDGRVPDEALNMVPAGALIVYLDHYPSAVAFAARHKMDLCLSGHTHGGQIALPFYGAIVTFSDAGKRYESGLYRVEDTWLYVNRGLGMDPYPFPPVRFCARPEVTVLDVIPESPGVPKSSWR